MVFRNGIYNKFCIRISMFCNFDKNEENHYFFTGHPLLENMQKFRNASLSFFNLSDNDLGNIVGRNKTSLHPDIKKFI